MSTPDRNYNFKKKHNDIFADNLKFVVRINYFLFFNLKPLFCHPLYFSA